MLEALEAHQQARLLHHEEQKAAADAAADVMVASETRERAIYDLELTRKLAINDLEMTRKMAERPHHRVEAEIFIDAKIVDERRKESES